MPRSWTGITDNKIITREDLKKAVDDRYLDYKENQVIVVDSNILKTLTTTGVTSLVEVEPSSLEGRSSNQLVPKVRGRRPKEQCVTYNVTVRQIDLDSSDDGKVYVYYYPCGQTGGTASFTTYSYSGTFLSTICVQNYPNLDPYVQIFYDGGVPNTDISSRIVLLPGQCTPEKNVVISMSGCTSNSGLTNTFTYQITKPAIKQAIDLTS